MKRIFVYYDFARSLKLEKIAGRSSLSGQLPALVFLGIIPVLVSEMIIFLLGWINVQLEQPYYLHIALIGVSICYFLVCGASEFFGKRRGSDDN